MKFPPLKTCLLAAVFFLLPWQTRWIFGYETLDGAATPFGVLSVHIVEILVVVTALITFVRKQDRPQIDKTYYLPLTLTVAILVVTALSLLWTTNLAVSLNQLFHVGAAMILFMLMLDKKVQLKPLLYAFGLGLIPAVALGFWQIAFDWSPASTILGIAERNAQTLGDAVTVSSDGVRQLRAYGSFSHPNIFGGYLAVGLLALAAVIPNVKRWTSGKAAMFLLIVGLAFTASRSAVLGLLLGFGLAGLVSRMKHTAKARILVIPIAIVVIGGALAATLFAPNILASIRGGGATEDRSLSERAEQYADYPAVVDGQWPLGHGLGTYTFAAYEATTCSDWDCQPIHSVPLLIIGEIGIIGALIVFSWSSSIDRINFARFPNRDALVAFAMGNVVLVILFFDHYIWSQWSGLALIAFVMALTVRMGEDAK